MLGDPGAGWRTRRRQQREYHEALDAQVQEARQRKQESRDARRGANAERMFPALAPSNPVQAEPVDDRMEIYNGERAQEALVPHPPPAPRPVAYQNGDGSGSAAEVNEGRGGGGGGGGDGGSSTSGSASGSGFIGQEAGPGNSAAAEHSMSLAALYAEVSRLRHGVVEAQEQAQTEVRLRQAAEAENAATRRRLQALEGELSSLVSWRRRADEALEAIGADDGTGAPGGAGFGNVAAKRQLEFSRALEEAQRSAQVRIAEAANAAQSQIAQLQGELAALKQDSTSALANLGHRQSELARGTDANAVELEAIKARASDVAVATATGTSRAQAGVQEIAGVVAELSAKMQHEREVQQQQREVIDASHAAMQQRFAELESATNRKLELAAAESRQRQSEARALVTTGEEHMQGRITEQSSAVHGRVEALELALATEREDARERARRHGAAVEAQLKEMAQRQSHELLVAAKSAHQLRDAMRADVKELTRQLETTTKRARDRTAKGEHAWATALKVLRKEVVASTAAMTQKLAALEEVVRAEVRSRLKTEKQEMSAIDAAAADIRSTQTELRALVLSQGKKLTERVNAVEDESREELLQARTRLMKRLEAVETAQARAAAAVDSVTWRLSVRVDSNELRQEDAIGALREELNAAQQIAEEYRTRVNAALKQADLARDNEAQERNSAITRVQAATTTALEEEKQARVQANNDLEKVIEAATTAMRNELEIMATDVREDARRALNAETLSRREEAAKAESAAKDRELAATASATVGTVKAVAIERETARKELQDEREQRKEMQQKMEERMRRFAQDQAISEAGKAHAAANAAADSVEKLKIDSNVKTAAVVQELLDTATELREADRVAADNMKRALRELCANERSRREAAALQTVTNVRETLLQHERTLRIALEQSSGATKALAQANLQAETAARLQAATRAERQWQTRHAALQKMLEQLIDTRTYDVATSAADALAHEAQERREAERQSIVRFDHEHNEIVIHGAVEERLNFMVDRVVEIAQLSKDARVAANFDAAVNHMTRRITEEAEEARVARGQERRTRNMRVAELHGRIDEAEVRECLDANIATVAVDAVATTLSQHIVANTAEDEGRTVALRELQRVVKDQVGAHAELAATTQRGRILAQVQHQVTRRRLDTLEVTILRAKDLAVGESDDERRLIMQLRPRKLQSSASTTAVSAADAADQRQQNEGKAEDTDSDADADDLLQAAAAAVNTIRTAPPKSPTRSGMGQTMNKTDSVNATRSTLQWPDEQSFSFDVSDAAHDLEISVRDSGHLDAENDSAWLVAKQVARCSLPLDGTLSAGLVQEEWIKMTDATGQFAGEVEIRVQWCARAKEKQENEASETAKIANEANEVATQAQLTADGAAEAAAAARTVADGATESASAARTVADEAQQTADKAFGLANSAASTLAPSGLAGAESETDTNAGNDVGAKAETEAENAKAETEAENEAEAEAEPGASSAQVKKLQSELEAKSKVAAQEKERFEKELAVKDSELEELRKKVRVLEGASYANTTVASEGAET